MNVQKKLLFGQAQDPTVIGEPLIRAQLAQQGEGTANLNEVTTLSLSYKSKYFADKSSFLFLKTFADCRHPEDRQFGRHGQS